MLPVRVGGGLVARLCGVAWHNCMQLMVHGTELHSLPCWSVFIHAVLLSTLLKLAYMLSHNICIFSDLKNVLNADFTLYAATPFFYCTFLHPSVHYHFIAGNLSLFYSNGYYGRECAPFAVSYTALCTTYNSNRVFAYSHKTYIKKKIQTLWHDYRTIKTIKKKRTFSKSYTEDSSNTEESN